MRIARGSRRAGYFGTATKEAPCASRSFTAGSSPAPGATSTSGTFPGPCPRRGTRFTCRVARNTPSASPTPPPPTVGTETDSARRCLRTARWTCRGAAPCTCCPTATCARFSSPTSSARARSRPSRRCPMRSWSLIVPWRSRPWAPCCGSTRWTCSTPTTWCCNPPSPPRCARNCRSRSSSTPTAAPSSTPCAPTRASRRCWSRPSRTPGR